MQVKITDATPLKNTPHYSDGSLTRSSIPTCGPQSTPASPHEKIGGCRSDTQSHINNYSPFSELMTDLFQAYDDRFNNASYPPSNDMDTDGAINF